MCDVLFALCKCVTFCLQLLLPSHGGYGQGDGAGERAVDAAAAAAAAAASHLYFQGIPAVCDELDAAASDIIAPLLLDAGTFPHKH
jgi:hypothetical protein